MTNVLKFPEKECDFYGDLLMDAAKRIGSRSLSRPMFLSELTGNPEHDSIFSKISSPGMVFSSEQAQLFIEFFRQTSKGFLDGYKEDVGEDCPFSLWGGEKGSRNVGVTFITELDQAIKNLCLFRNAAEDIFNLDADGDAEIKSILREHI